MLFVLCFHVRLKQGAVSSAYHGSMHYFVFLSLCFHSLFSKYFFYLMKLSLIIKSLQCMFFFLFNIMLMAFILSTEAKKAKENTLRT